MLLRFGQFRRLAENIEHHYLVLHRSEWLQWTLFVFTSVFLWPPHCTFMTNTVAQNVYHPSEVLQVQCQ